MGKLIPKLYEDGSGCDVIIAHSIREARKYCKDEFGIGNEEVEDMDRLIDLEGRTVWIMFSNTEELRSWIERFGELKVGIWASEVAALLTYKQAMEIYNPDDIPGIFSTTEW